jgi:hypothetical protein
VRALGVCSASLAFGRYFSALVLMFARTFSAFIDTAAKTTELGDV